MMVKNKVGVSSSGRGECNGAEIQEAVLTLRKLDQQYRSDSMSFIYVGVGNK